VGSGEEGWGAERRGGGRRGGVGSGEEGWGAERRGGEWRVGMGRGRGTIIAFTMKPMSIMTGGLTI
jgi:hypothetical protein